MPFFPMNIKESSFQYPCINPLISPLFHDSVWLSKTLRMVNSSFVWLKPTSENNNADKKIILFIKNISETNIIKSLPQNEISRYQYAWLNDYSPWNDNDWLCGKNDN